MCPAHLWVRCSWATFWVSSSKTASSWVQSCKKMKKHEKAIQRERWQNARLELWRQTFQDCSLFTLFQVVTERETIMNCIENSEHGMLKICKENTRVWGFYTFFWGGGCVCRKILLKIGVRCLLLQNREQCIEHRYGIFSCIRTKQVFKNSWKSTSNIYLLKQRKIMHRPWKT